MAIDHAKIKIRRDEIGLTQIEVARRAKMDQSAYNRIETGGRRDPAFSTVSRIADALETTTDDLRKRPRR